MPTTTMMVTETATDRIGVGDTHAVRIRRPRIGLTGQGGGERNATNAIRLPRRTRSAKFLVVVRSGKNFVNGRWNNEPSVSVVILDTG